MAGGLESTKTNPSSVPFSEVHLKESACGGFLGGSPWLLGAVTAGDALAGLRLQRFG